MGKRGPQKTPRAILKLHGSNRAKGRAEAAVIKNDFACPEDLVGEARIFWCEFKPVMDRLGVLSLQDIPMFRMLCDSWSDYMELRGTQDVHMRIKVRSEFLRIASHFGITPATRSDVSFESLKEENPFLRMSNGTV